MSDEPVARKAMRRAERGVRDDASRLVAAVPALMKEAQRRRTTGGEGSPSLVELATSALPKLAAATAVVVIAATWIVVSERRGAAAAATATPASLESVIVGSGSEGTGDVVFDAVLAAGRNDG
jgi:hypothetical protein